MLLLEIHMENQINVGDQNTQQIEQNPVNQPVLTPEKPKTNYLLIGGLVLVCFVLFGFGGYYLGKQSDKTENLTTGNYSLPTNTPITSTQPAYPSTTPSASIKSTYTYSSFSFSYPKDWRFISKKDDTNFPLKSRLIFDEEVVAVEKDDIYLIVNISKTGQLEAGGIFIDDKDYNEFISTRDKVMINGSTFYLTKNHPSISVLEEAHSGPAMWGALSEYIPNKVTGSGNVFRGYEQIIKRNGYMYNIIVVGQKEENTPTPIQSDIKEILESIKW